MSAVPWPVCMLPGHDECSVMASMLPGVIAASMLPGHNDKCSVRASMLPGVSRSQIMLPGHDECRVTAGTTMPSVDTSQYVARTEVQCHGQYVARSTMSAKLSSRVSGHDERNVRTRWIARVLVGASRQYIHMLQWAHTVDLFHTYHVIP
jgi:hypothetical protein